MTMIVGEHNYWAAMKASAEGIGTKWEAVAKHDTNPVGSQYKYVFCSAAGTAVMKDTVGTSLTLTLAANERLPVVPTVLTTASTGTFIGVLE